MKAEFEADDLSYRCHGHFHSCRHRLSHCRAVASRQYVAASVQCLLSGLVIVLAGSDGEAARRRQGRACTAGGQACVGCCCERQRTIHIELEVLRMRRRRACAAAERRLMVWPTWL